jgi:phage protein D
MPNFFAPTFRVEINGARLAADVSYNVESLSVVTSPNTLDTFQLTISNEYPRMRWTHTPDAELFREGNSVTIAFGYVDELEVLFDGEITQVSPSFPSSGVPTLSVNGHSRLHWLQRGKTTRTFQKMTDKQIIEKIAQDNGLQPQVEDPGITYDYIMQPNQTDLEFVRARAARIHFEVFVEAKTLIFRKMKEADEDIYTLVWGQTQQGLSAPNTFPLVEFTPSMNARNATPSIKVRGYDPMTKQAIIAEAGTSDQNGTMGGSVKGGDVWQGAFQKPREFVRVSTPVQTHAEGVEHAKAIYNNKVINMTTGNGSTIGLPALRSGKVVKLEGLGPRFSGKYYLDQVTHTIGQSGYTTAFSVKRNATS